MDYFFKNYFIKNKAQKIYSQNSVGELLILSLPYLLQTDLLSYRELYMIFMGSYQIHRDINYFEGVWPSAIYSYSIEPLSVLHSKLEFEW